MVLEHPGLGQRRAAGLEERAQFHRVGPLDDEVELGAPMAGDAVGHRLDELIGAEGSARGRNGKVRLHAVGQVRERRVEPLVYELTYALGARLAGLAAATEPRRDG